MARILVIDDEALLRQTIEAMLRTGGHEVVLAVDGADGLRQFQPDRFDLVLCDYYMPGLQGPEAVKELRRRAPDMPIVSMTGSIPSADIAQPDSDFQRMNIRSGATRTIAKPFRTAHLLAVVQQCLESVLESK